MITRDQQRALAAYDALARVAEAPVPLRESYKVAVNGLSAHVMRSGLAAALAFLERSAARDDRGGEATFLQDIGASLPHTHAAAPLPARARAADLAEYVLLTREVLKLAVWFKRACQATL